MMIDNIFLNNLGLSNIHLRQYQLDGVNWFLDCINNKHGGILADEMGLGKTIQTISTILCLRNMNYKKFIIISPLSVINNWKNEFTKFTPNLSFLVYMGSKENRLNVRNSDQWNSESIILITTYEYLIQDYHEISSRNFDLFFMDEGHRIKNDTSLLYDKVNQMPCQFRFLLTGTPIQNNLDELYNLISIVTPTDSIHSISRQKFKLNLSQYHQSNDTVVSRPVYQLDPYLSKSILRRIKIDVLQCLPDKREVLIFHGLTTVQKRLYKSILTKKSDFLINGMNGSIGTTKTTSTAAIANRQLLNVLIQLRKCVLHPYLFPGLEREPYELGEHIVEQSAKMRTLDRLLNHLIPLGHKILIFSQMTKMLDIVQDYCTLRRFRYERLDGSVRSEERFAAIDNFSNDTETSLFLLSTRAGGQGLNLTAADTVIFVDSDFNPQIDLQAMARIHRPGQRRPCRIIRLVAKHSVEEMIVHRSQQKLDVSRGILGDENQKTGSSNMNIKEMVCYGLEKLLVESDEESSADPSSSGSCSDLSVLSNEFLTSILGATDENGHWQPVEKEIVCPVNENVNSIDHMYVFEGLDYKPQPSKKDYQIAEDLAKSSMVDLNRISKSNNGRIDGAAVDLFDAGKKSKQEPKRQSTVNRRKERLWQDNNYMSCNLDQPTSDDDSEFVTPRIDNWETSADVDSGPGNDSDLAINYVIGDVTAPVGDGDRLKIICHLVDNTGSWGTGGLFSALDHVNGKLSIDYLRASEMEDLKLGDCHVFQFKPNVKVALLVAQTRDNDGRLSAIKMNSLETGLERVRRFAVKHKASVHFARLGYKTPKFNWYGIERLIEKHLTERNVETFVYYFRRSVKRGHSAKKLSDLYWKSILTDVVIYFDSSIDELKRNILTRHVYALNGKVTNDPEDSTITHHLVDGAVLQAMDCVVRMDGVFYLTYDWLLECVRQNSIISLQQFSV